MVYQRGPVRSRTTYGVSACIIPKVNEIHTRLCMQLRHLTYLERQVSWQRVRDEKQRRQAAGPGPKARHDLRATTFQSRVPRFASAAARRSWATCLTDTTLRCAVLCCAVLRCAALRCAVLCCAVLRCAVLRCAALRCAVL
jgi:hypothetical protein